jgi:hypothetical protein
MRNTLKLSPTLFASLVFVSCAPHVPAELKTAIDKQAQELQQIKAKHTESVEVLFESIRTLQLYILNDLEYQYQQKYSHGLQKVKLADESEGLVYSMEAPPSYNPNLDFIPVSTSKIISDWFANERTQSEKKLQTAKEEFLKLDDHIEIAQQINQAVSEYLDSLINLRGAQAQLEKTLVQKVASIPAAPALNKTLLGLLVPETQQLDAVLDQNKKH